MKALAIVAALGLVAAFARSSAACSVAGCPGDGIEVRPDFVVRITHQDKPLFGVTVEISGNGTKNELRTGADGKVYISKLPSGDYWLSAELLGISAAYTCFHVSQHASRKARKALRFEWGESPIGTRQVAGRLQISQLGKGGTLVWNVTHKIDAPISNAKLTLKSPSNEAEYSTVSDRDGRFAFREIPNGVYVLQIQGGATQEGDTFGPDSLLLRLSPSAKLDTLVMTPNVGGGSCGGWSLALR
ncbi:MAG: carboxypeptidase regulatory-like domain-containing protein [Candidatus Acidiferrum sp.]